MQSALDIWLTELGKSMQLQQPVAAVIYDDLAAMIENIRRRQIDYVAMTAIDYLKIRDQVEIEPVLTPVVGGKMGEEYALIINKSSPWQDLKQLQGKRLLVQNSSGACDQALLWLDTQLLKQKLPPSQAFFQSVAKVDKASQTVLPVFFRQADAALLPRWSYDTMAELNPQLKEQTTILASSVPLARGGLFMVKGVAPEKRQLIQATLSIWRSPRAKQLMTLFHSEEIVAFQPSYFQTMISLYEDYQGLVKKH